MAQLGQIQFYKRNINGTDTYTAMPFGGNDPWGYTNISKDEYIQGINKNITDLQKAREDYTWNSDFTRGVSKTNGQNYVGNSPDARSLSDLQQKLQEVNNYDPNYRDPSFKNFLPNAPTPSEQYYTPEYRATLPPQEQQRLNQLYGQNNPITPADPNKKVINLGNGNYGYANKDAPIPGSTPNQPTGVQQGGSTTTPTPTGINTITKTLNYGSQGADVKELQNYLMGMGAVGADGKPLKANGIYNNDTKAAVLQFQQQHGLTQDGIFGPQSLAAAQKVTNTTTQYGTGGTTTPPPATSSTTTPPTTTTSPPSVTGNPAQDALLQQLQDYIKSQQDAGLKINSALNFDQPTLDKFLETAKKQIHPYYAQQIDAIKADVLKAAPQILANYGSDVASKEASFQNDLSTSRENNAGAGLAFSGSRAKAELGAVDAQNRDLASLSQTYGNKLYDLGRTAESKIGASATPSLGSLTNYSANLSGNGGFNSTGSSTPYTPGGYQTGSLTNQEQQDIEARNQALKKTASESVVAGRDYQSLFA